MTVYTEESRDVLRVRPSEAAETDPDIEDRIDQIASLHDLHHQPDSGFIGKVLGDGTGAPVQFELLALSSGPDHPVEIYYSCDGQLETLEKRLDAIYPSSFTIERSTLDIGAKLITPVTYSPSEFLEELKAGNLAYSLDDLAEDVAQSTNAEFGGELESGLDTDTEDGLVPLNEFHNVSTPTASTTSTDRTIADGQSTPQAASKTDNSSESMNVSDSTGNFETEVWVRTDDVPSDHRFLRLDDHDGKAVKINPSSELDDVDDHINLSRPTFTEDRQILARPSRDQVEPSAVRWRGKANRKKDWMTTFRSDGTAGLAQQAEYTPKPSVIAELLTQLSEMEPPVVFQATFKRKSNWKVKATSRKKDLKRGEDTTVQTALSAVLGSNTESDTLATSVQKRIDQIEAKNPRRTFDVNLRAVSVDAEAAIRADDEDASTSDAVDAKLRRLAPVFDPLDGQYYEIDGTVVEPGSKVSTETSSTPEEELDYLLDRELTTSDDEESLTERWVGSSSIHAELVANPQELSDIITIPPGEEMPKEAFRGARVKHEEESPLPRPNNAILDKFSEGMAVGTPLDEDRHELDEPIQLPTDVLTTHYARFATTGFGKSIATNNDLLTLQANTDGPEILIDPKGDGMCERYLKAHYAEFGDLRNAYLFDVPEDLPAIGFFDIRPLLAQGQSREDAIQDKVDHFHEIMRMVMGDAYDNAYVAIMVLSFLIKAMFDPEYGQDAFRLEDLYSQAVRMQREERAPQVAPTRTEVEESLDRHFDNDDASFQETMTAVLNRLDKLREDTHLYRMFNHLSEWDPETQTYASSSPALSFTEFFEKDAVLLFDLGDLRPNAARAMALVLLSGLWDDLQQRDAAADTSQVNLILEEAAPFAATDLMTEQLLAKARSFNLSIGLIMQYPGQVRAENERTYAEIRNNVHSTFYGKIENEDVISDSLATQELDPVTLKTKLTSMRPGEWLADLPSPEFNTPEPSPFSIQALPIPDGHPDGENPLDTKTLRKFREAQLPRSRNRVKRNYSIQRREPRQSTTAATTSEAGDTGNSTGSPSDGSGRETDSVTSAQSGGAPNDVAPANEDETERSNPAEARTSSVFSSGSIGAFDDSNAPENVFDDDNATAHSQSPSDTDEDTAVEGSETNGTSRDREPAVQTDETSQSVSGDDVVTANEHVDEGSTDQTEEEIDSLFGSEGNLDEQSERHGPSGSPRSVRHMGDRSLLDSDADSNLVIETDPEPADATPIQNDPRETSTEASSDEETHRESAETAEYESLQAVYAEARRINRSQSGADKFEALMDLSSAAEAAGFDVDDDALTDPPDEDSADKVRSDTQPTPSNQSRSTNDANPESSGSESDHSSSGQGSSDGASQTPSDRPDSGRSPTASGEGARAESQSGWVGDGPDTRDRVDEHDETVRVHQPGFSEPDTQGEPEHDLSDADEEFLHLILSAMNGELQDYSLLHLGSMKPLVDRIDDADIDRLKELGFIEQHRVIRKQYYSVLPAGREHLQRSLSSRDGIGDLGEKTPHKVGVAILWHYLAKREDTTRVARYESLNDKKFDVVAYDTHDDVVAVGEAETPSNNAEAIITDYEKMSELDADAVWLCKNRGTAMEIIDALEQHDILEADEFMTADTKSFSALMEAVDEKSLPGMTEIQGFTSCYDDLEL